MQVTIQIVGDKQVEAALTKLGSDLLMLKEAMTQIGAEAARYYGDEGMRSQGQVFDQDWQRLSDKYSVWKAKHYPGRGILERTGKLAGSFYFEADDNSVRVGNSVDYFKYHQSTEQRTKIPRRAPMGINDTLKQMIKTVIEADIRRKIDSAGLA